MKQESKLMSPAPFAPIKRVTDGFQQSVERSWSCNPHASGCSAGAIAAGVAAPAAADDYPNRPVKLVMGFGPGGWAISPVGHRAEDVASLGKPIVIENMPGAGGMTAAASGRARARRPYAPCG